MYHITDKNCICVVYRGPFKKLRSCIDGWNFFADGRSDIWVINRRRYTWLRYVRWENRFCSRVWLQSRPYSIRLFMKVLATHQHLFLHISNYTDVFQDDPTLFHPLLSIRIRSIMTMINQTRNPRMYSLRSA